MVFLSSQRPSLIRAQENASLKSDTHAIKLYLSLVICSLYLEIDIYIKIYIYIYMISEYYKRYIDINMGKKQKTFS